MIVSRSTSAKVGAPGRTDAGTTGSSSSPVVNAVIRSSAARVPPSSPARSIPWIESESA
jgi:hypothetical protein